MRKGYLDVIPVAGVKDKRAQKRWVVLNPNGEGGVCLDHYDSEYFQTTGSIRSSTPLRNCRNFEVSKSSPYTFEFTCNAGSYKFGCDSREEAEGWVQDIIRAMAQERMKSSSASGLSRSQPNASSPETSGIFSVTLKQNQVAKRLKLTGKYNLRITLKNLTLREEGSDVRVATWTYDQLRQFTAYKNRIEIEAGRRAETGPGVYIFMSSHAEEIGQLMTRNIKAIDEKIKRLSEAEAALAKEKEKHLPDPFENPSYVDNPLPQVHRGKDKGEPSHEPFENPNYVENPYFIQDSPSSDRRGEVDGIKAQSKFTSHDYEEVEFQHNPGAANVKAGAGPHYASVEGQHGHNASSVLLVEDYITMQEARLNALSLGQPLTDANTPPRPVREKTYAKVNKPPKSLTPDTRHGQSSPNVAAARPEKGPGGEQDSEYMLINQNPSYVSTPHTNTAEVVYKKSPWLEDPTGNTVYERVLHIADSEIEEVTFPESLIQGEGANCDGECSTSAEPKEYAGHFEEIDKMWNETWNK